MPLALAGHRCIPRSHDRSGCPGERREDPDGPHRPSEIPASFIRHIDHQKRWIAEHQDDLRQILDHLEVVIRSADRGVGYWIKQSQASAKFLNKAGCRALTPDGPVLYLE
jgi:hypothetical protein